jgi:hypothetical protein
MVSRTPLPATFSFSGENAEETTTPPERVASGRLVEEMVHSVGYGWVVTIIAVVAVFCLAIISILWTILTDKE